MKHTKLIMLICMGALLIGGKSFGQANPFINVLPSNSGVVPVGGTIDIEVTIGNSGPISTIPQAKLRPIIQIPTSVTFLPNAQQTGLPAGWTILSNTGSQLRVCNSTDPIPVNTSRTIILKAQGVTATPPQTFAGNINFGNGTTCAAGPSVAGDLITDNSATSTIQVVAPVTLNLNLFIEGYWDGANAMFPVLANQGLSNPLTHCDSIIVELHEANAPFGSLFSKVSVLHTNGTASMTLSPSVTPGNYYIVIKHRNGVETWSAAPVSLPATTTYNFSTAATQAYGNNQIQMAPGIFALYTGDINQDDVVDGLDYNDWETDNNNFGSGYLAADINGDGVVDGLDFIYWEQNSNNFVGVAMP